jgi:uncharacterized protein (DUF488 family)
LPALGGRRRPHGNSPNTGWRNASFRGYADHLATAEFENGFAALLGLSQQAPLAMMCAEAVWWRCHRRLIADVLVVRGVEAEHILDQRNASRHELTAFAVVEGTRITYPASVSNEAHR